MLLNLDPLSEVILTCLHTAYVKNAIPISAILVAQSGTAKSSLIRMVHGPFIHHTDSFTSQGLWDIVEHDKDGKIRFILVPDINPSLSRKPSTVQAAVANLLSLTFDGTLRVDDGRQNKECKHNPVGFISAVTPEIYKLQARKWFALGLRRRIIPLFYGYSEKTIYSVQSAVADGKINPKVSPSKPLNILREADLDISVQISRELQSMSSRFAMLLGKAQVAVQKGDTRIKKWYVDNIVPIPPHLILRTLAKANAMKRGTAKVDMEDLQFILDFLSFCDPETPRQL